MRFLPERLVFERVLASGGFAQCFITVSSQCLFNPLINCNWDLNVAIFFGICCLHVTSGLIAPV